MFTLVHVEGRIYFGRIFLKSVYSVNHEKSSNCATIKAGLHFIINFTTNLLLTANKNAQ